ncbi:MAG: tRNA lysidine(34) synthetase TilS [Salinisphaeraceae bacterium]|nr:tRNA lysidine(34) synthetase TilS [Salinisphaeraceae bacterium]
MTTVAEALAALPPLAAGERYAVAYSGGRDSTVLLHALGRQLPPGRLRALHVHHGMQPAADEWPAHCRRICRQLNVPLEVLDCSAQVQGGLARLGPEAAARQARYRALRAALAPKEALLTAHHARDQAETFLLQALRGSGPRGLAAMPACVEQAEGRLLRPLLRVPSAAIHAYARLNELDWVDDPSNADPRHDRARLRGVWPTLQAGWPALEQTLGRAAAHQAEARELLGELARMDRVTLADKQGSLDIRALSALSRPRQKNCLRHWLADGGLELPQARQLDDLLEQLDASSVLRCGWGDTEVRAFKGRLYAMAALPPPEAVDTAWPPASADDSVMAAQRVVGAGLAESRGPYRVQTRRGGEVLRLAGRTHRSALKTLLQAAEVPPWVRERLPLILHEGRVVAVADWWVDPAYAPEPGAPGWEPIWTRPMPGTPSRQIVRRRAFG